MILVDELGVRFTHHGHECTQKQIQKKSLKQIRIYDIVYGRLNECQIARKPKTT